MKIAWLTHHIPRVQERGSALLPGKYAGGAERNNDYMVTARPDHIDVEWIDAPDWEYALDGSFDEIVITGTDRLTEEAMLAFAERSPVVWIQHHQHRTPAKRTLFRKARRFITMSAAHMGWEAEWTDRADTFIHSPVPPDSVQPGDKSEGFALFAGRDHPAKGKINARIWAQQHNVELVELVNADHDVVLNHMSRATYFVHLPKERDACPLVVIEATLAGCEVITNSLVGRLELGDPATVLAAQPPKFWAMVEEK
jgi:hypothetical protein